MSPATAAVPADGWSGLFSAAFRQSRNAMVLVDDGRRIVDVNGSLVALLGRGRDALVGHAIGEFVDGGPIASPAEWQALLGKRRFRPEVQPPAEPARLSPRQREVVRLVAHGQSGPEIAEELQIGEETVRSHVRTAMARLGTRSRAHLVAKALGEGHI